MSGGVYKVVLLGNDHKPIMGAVVAESTVEADVLPHWEAGRTVLTWTPDTAPVRRLSKTGLASVRQKRLRRRLEKKHPLLADVLFEQETTTRPKYFNGEQVDNFQT